jgi:hypothetical protein
MEPEVADPVHFHNRMMQLVKFPEEGHAVQKVVHAPAEEIFQQKIDECL